MKKIISIILSAIIIFSCFSVVLASAEDVYQTVRFEKDTGVIVYAVDASNNQTSETYDKAAKVLFDSDLKFIVRTENPSMYTYVVVTVQGQDAPLTAQNGVYTLPQVTSNKVVEVRLASRSVRFTCDAETTVSSADVAIVNNVATARKGTSFRFDVTVPNGFNKDCIKATVKNGLATITADDAFNASSTNKKRFVVQTDNHIEIIIKYQAVSANITCGEGVEVTYQSHTTSADRTIPMGADFSFNVRATEEGNDKYIAVVVNDKELPYQANGRYFIKNVQSNLNISVYISDKTFYAEFEERDRHVRVVPCEGYSQYIRVGDDLRFYIEVDDGYSDAFVIVQVNGENVEPDVHGVYTVRDVRANFTVKAFLSMEDQQSNLFASLIVLVRRIADWFKNILDTLKQAFAT